MTPACMPVTREPTAVTTDPWGADARSRRCSTSGSRTTRNPSTLARIQPGRSTTATVPPSAGPGSPVTSRTGSRTAAASSRSSATTFLASALLTCGPGLTQRTPVEVATSQSIICALLTPPPYVPRRRLRLGHRRARLLPGPRRLNRAAVGAAAASRSAAAAGRELGSQLVDGAAGLAQPVLGNVVCHEREGQQLPVAGIGDSGQRYHAGQVAGLRPERASRQSRPPATR